MFHSHLPPNFQPPDHYPQSPQIPTKIPQNRSRITSTHLRKVLYFQPFPTPKNPQFHRITLKSHPKIAKSQTKSTHSRTKSNNPIITTKIHTTPPSRHTPNHHKNKAKTHINALTQYTKTSLLQGKIYIAIYQLLTNNLNLPHNKTTRSPRIPPKLHTPPYIYIYTSFSH